MKLSKNKGLTIKEEKGKRLFDINMMNNNKNSLHKRHYGLPTTIGGIGIGSLSVLMSHYSKMPDWMPFRYKLIFWIVSFIIYLSLFIALIIWCYKLSNN